MMFTLFFRGQLIPIPSVEKALRVLESEPPSDDPFRSSRRAIIGSPEQVRTGIEEVAAEYGASEAMIVTITYDHQARRRSYELIAETFGLATRG